jgi:hypothetical protein
MLRGNAFRLSDPRCCASQESHGNCGSSWLLKIGAKAGATPTLPACHADRGIRAMGIAPGERALCELLLLVCRGSTSADIEAAEFNSVDPEEVGWITGKQEVIGVRRN